MGLETPLALLGLALAGLPFLLHRIRRRDLVPIALPTFHLLLDAEARKRRSRGLTDILLLILRVAILTAACMALAAPYVTARLSFGDGSVASVAIIIDDSMSMMRREGGSTLLEQAADRARQAVRSLPGGSEISLIAGGSRPRVLLRRTSTLDLAELELDRIIDGPLRGTQLGDAVELGVQQLGGARNSNRRLLVLSDFAAHSRLTPDQLGYEGIPVTLERIGSQRTPTNLHFTSARALADPTAKGQTSVAFELAADGDVPAPVPVVVLSGGEELARTEVAVAGGKGRATVHVPTPARDQDPTALLRIESSDGLVDDNVIGVLLRRADAVQVMLVNGDPHPASSEDELFYAQSALRLLPGSAGILSVRAVDADALGKYDLATVDVVVLANVSAPGPQLARRLREFVERGGGLLVTAGKNVRPRAYNAALGEVLPCRLRARSHKASKLAPVHESGLLGGGPSGLTRVETTRRLLLECDGGAELRYEDGSPALSVADRGRGRAALLATTLDADWGDLPLRPGYLPLLVHVLRHLSQTEGLESGPVAPGDSVRVPVPPAAAELEVVTPEGLRHRYADLKGKAVVEFGETHSAGPYRVLASSGAGALTDAPRGAFVVDVPAGESDLSALAELASLTPSASQEGGGAVVQHSLSPFLLLLFAFLVLAEGGVRLRSG
ncbi:MAG: BatA and WFA domain-containing protein [Myxococcales bacterium]|nr:BatA and WFA domain-containing protein [Myxococcales bacterium]